MISDNEVADYHTTEDGTWNGDTEIEDLTDFFEGATVDNDQEEGLEDPYAYEDPDEREARLLLPLRYQVYHCLGTLDKLGKEKEEEGKGVKRRASKDQKSSTASLD